jgi:hypothetical protein
VPATSIISAWVGNRQDKLAQSLAKAFGGMVIGGEDDSWSLGWERKWEVYRDFRRAFRLASNDGLVLVSI